MADAADPARPPAWAMFSATQAMGFLFAFAAVWPLVRFTGALVAFAVAWLGASLYFLRKRSPTEVVGSGLYASAGGVAVTPVQAFAPTLLAGTDGALGASVVVGTVQGLIAWVTVCGLVALAMAALGRYLKGVARRREVEAFRVRRWYHER